MVAGDVEFKLNKALPAEKQIVTANPDITTVRCISTFLAHNFCNFTWAIEPLRIIFIVFDTYLNCVYVFCVLLSNCYLLIPLELD